jgi:serine/threonine-protein kinase
MEPSEVIGDRYELLDAIGRGGMATIYRALDPRMGSTVAVKNLREVDSSDPKFVTRFKREANAASALQHPNIVQVFDFGQSNGNYFIVMEFIEGSDLRQYMKREGILSNERAIEIAHDVALGLGIAHRRGIVHRDVKPQNILLNHEGLVKLTDFGIASVYKGADDERLTTTGMTLGTVQYYAPEQAQGEIVQPAADVYALGIVLYEMVVGRTPFDGDTPVAVAMKHIQELPEPPRHFNSHISPALERLILRCLEKDPRDRYRDGDALAYALEQVAHAPAARRTGPSAPQPGRGQFMPPLSLPTNDRGPAPIQGGRSGLYGGPAVASGPRGDGQYSTGRPNGYGRGDYDEPPYDAPGYEPPGGYPGAPPTRPGEAAPGTVPRMPWPGAKRPDGGDDKKNNGTVMALVGGIAVFFLLACILVAVLTGAPKALGQLFGPGPTPAPTVQLVQVPNFKGMSFADAQKLASGKGLNVTQTPKKDDSKAGTVLDQDQAAGSSIASGGTINLTVSAGPDQVPVPDVTGMSLKDACDAITHAELVCQKGGFVNSSVPYGNVASSDPKANTSVAKGSTVTLTISAGQPTPSPSPTATPTPTPTPTATATACPTGNPTPTPCP